MTLGVSVLSTFGFPEAGGLVAIQSRAHWALAAPEAGPDICPVVSNLVGFPLPCNELKLVPVRLGADPHADSVRPLLPTPPPASELLPSSGCRPSMISLARTAT